MLSDTLAGAEGRDDQKLDGGYGGRAEGARQSPPDVALTIGGVVATLMQSPVTLARLPAPYRVTGWPASSLRSACRRSPSVRARADHFSREPQRPTGKLFWSAGRRCSICEICTMCATGNAP